MKKYILFIVLLVLGVWADLGTKSIAEDRLASRSRDWDHPIELVIEGDQDRLLSDLLAAEFTSNSEDEIEQICQQTYLVNDEGELIRRGSPGLLISPGQQLRVLHREVTVIENFLGFKYVENRGAAWGFLGDADQSFSRPFFIIVGILAIFVIGFLFRSVGDDRKFLIVALSFIVAGAIGNIADRIRYGYVVDFIAWRPGFEWPTFNIADVLIVVGVAMMFIEVIRDGRREKLEKARAEAAGASPEPA